MHLMNLCLAQPVLKVEDVCNPPVCQPSLLHVNITKCEPAKSPIEQAEYQVTNYKQDPSVNLTINPLFWWRSHQDITHCLLDWQKVFYASLQQVCRLKGCYRQQVI